MSTGDEVFGQIQSMARSVADREGRPAPTAEYLTRHGLESFLDRLSRTGHRDNFVLKGGVLLAVYGVRRPTKDVDAEAINAAVSADHIAQVVRDIAAIAIDDGVRFDLDTVRVQEIREAADYPGLRMRVDTYIGPHKLVLAWDISTGDPIVPPPKRVTIPRVLGGEITMLGYSPETTVAEKGVTILERGITSTRWRDYVDNVRLAEEHGLNQAQLLESARAVARHRNIELGPITPVVQGYGALSQTKWAAWRRKEKLEDITEANLDDQMKKVAAALDPAFSKG